MVRRDVAATRIARAQTWLSDAEAILGRAPEDEVDYPRVQQESRQGLPALRTFLDAVARSAGL